MNRVLGLSKHNRTPLLYYQATNEAYDGVKHFKVTRQQLREWSITNSYKSDYIPIKCPEGKTLEEAHTEFIENADLLKFQSKGRINLYRSGTIKRAGLAWFFKQCCVKEDIDPEPPTEMENEWFMQCNHGQIVFSKPYEGETHSYDINSMYASIMRHVNFKIPIKQGTFQKLTTQEFDDAKFFQYGIYRVIIKNNGEENTRKMFRFNTNHYYTSTDLNVAKKLGLTMTLMEDFEFNFLGYGKGTCMTGSQVFKKFIDVFYKLKCETKNKDFKLVINMLYGTLCMSNVHKFQYDVTKELTANIDLDTDRVVILNQYFIRDNIFRIEYCYRNGNFKYPWVRMKPFILAFGRQMIGRIMQEHLDDIVSINTDGFKAVKKLNITTGTGIGDLRIEN